MRNSTTVSAKNNAYPYVDIEHGKNLQNDCQIKESISKDTFQLAHTCLLAFRAFLCLISDEQWFWVFTDLFIGQYSL